MSAYASRRRHSYITNIFKCGKQGKAFQIYLLCRNYVKYLI